jgi:hypothetical protein
MQETAAWNSEEGNGPVSAKLTGPKSSKVSKVPYQGLLGSLACFCSPGAAALAAIGLTASLPNRVK